MRVLKFLVSAALLGTVARCQTQNSPGPGYYSAYAPGGGLAQYSPSIYSRGTPRLVPFKVRAAPSRILPSFYYPPVPPPNLPPTYQQRQTRQLLPAYATALHHRPTFPPMHQQYRTAMTGYYRPARQSFFGFPFRHEQPQQQVAYHAAATSAPAVVKRGRIFSAASPYSLQAASASSAPSGGGFQYAPHSIPAVSTYRPAPQQYQHQLASAPTNNNRFQSQLQYQPQFQSPQTQVQYHPQQQQQPQYYLQKSPVVSARPLKLIKVKKPLPAATEAAASEEEEYPSDPNPQYNFSFDIKDDELTNYQNRQEERDGQTIKGSYSVVDPDGYVRTVTYTADPKNGFQAKVTREPTDVKIKFPVPTQAPQASQQALKQGRRVHQTYINPQQYTQPQQQYHTAYSSPRQTYAEVDNPPSATSTVQVEAAPLPTIDPTRFTRTRYAVQPQAAASAPQPRVVSVVSRGSKTAQSQSQSREQQTESDTETE